MNRWVMMLSRGVFVDHGIVLDINHIETLVAVQWRDHENPATSSVR